MLPQAKPDVLALHMGLFNGTVHASTIERLLSCVEAPLKSRTHGAQVSTALVRAGTLWQYSIF